MRLDIYIHDGNHERQITDLLNEIKEQGEQIMATLDETVAKIEEVSGKVESMRTFILALEQQISDVLSGVTLPPPVQAKLDKIFSDASGQSQAISDAIDNDPATPPTP